MRSKIKMGIAGCGNSAKNIHYKKLKSASDFFEVAAVFDLDLTRAEEIGKLYGAKAYGSLESFLNHPGMELVLVATKPPSTHTKIGLAALESGKHALLEKPMCASREEGIKLLEKAEETGKLLTVFHNRRTADWDADFAGVRFAIEEGYFGDVKIFESTVCGNLIDAEWIFDWGIHVFDQVLMTIKEKPVEVSCGASFVEGSAIKGPWAALIKFENGKTGIASMRTGLPGSHPRFSVMGETGGCSWPAGNAKIIEEENRLLIRVPEIHRGRRENPTASFEAEINFTPFYNNLYEAIKGDAELLVKPGEALAAVCATSAAMESCLTGRAVSLIYPEQPKP
jgi:scyllo-inositol 2-dehydrogenase (NADP+)